jgi:hypothetical protein
MNKLITLTAILTLASCTAYEKPEALNLNLGGFTKHTKERKGKTPWNETHNNIGVEYEKNNYFMNVETFKDSYGNRNGLIAGGYKPCFNKYVCTPIGLGYFTGYKNVDLAPYAGVEFNIGAVTLRTSYVPEVQIDSQNRTGFFFGGFRVKVWEF